VRRINDDLFAGQRALAADALDFLNKAKPATDRSDGANAVRTWSASNADAIARTKEFLEALEQSGELSVAKLTLANSRIRELAAR